MYTDTQFLNDLLKLLKQPTLTTNKPALQTVVEAITREIKQIPELSVEVFEKDGALSLLAYAGQVRPRSFKVLLNGHLDVVPAKDDQFTPQTKGSKLYARGALDMKTASLVFIKLFVELAPKLPYSLGLQLVTDEEMGGHNGTCHQLATQDIHAEFVLGGEMTQGDINNSSKGICWASLQSTGTTAHSAYLWQGQNAVINLSDQIRTVLSDYPVPPEEAWVTTVNVAMLGTDNQTVNRVPDTASATLDIRFVPDDPNFQSKQTALEYLGDMFPGAKVAITQFEAGHVCKTDNPFVRRLVASCEQVTGKKPAFIKKHGTSDLRFYAEHHIPSVNFGLSGDNIHGDGEYLDLRSLEPYRKTVKHFLQSLNEHEF